MQSTPTKSPIIKAGVDLEKVRAALVPVLEAQGVELVELEWLTERAGWTLRVTIERPGSSEASGGVTLEDCVEVSRDSSAVLDVADLIPQHYHLEVSSPGLDRKLRGAADFIRFRGQTAKVKLSRPAPDGQRVLRGRLEEAPEGRIAVLVDGKRIEVPADDVEEARLVYELQPEPKKGKPKRATKAERPKRAEVQQGRGGPDR
jgi:ribosome maturation factor RimP